MLLRGWRGGVPPGNTHGKDTSLLYFDEINRLVVLIDRTDTVKTTSWLSASRDVVLVANLTSAAGFSSLVNISGELGASKETSLRYIFWIASWPVMPSAAAAAEFSSAIVWGVSVIS